MRVLVTGASGFVGKALCTTLMQSGYEVECTVRMPKGITAERVVGQIDVSTDWGVLMEGVDAVVHLAARVHVLRDEARDPLAAFRSVNTEGTLNLARQCAAAGVKRFVFVSSIKVNGEGTLTPGPSPKGRGEIMPYTESDTPAPQDAYAISKWEAEQGLREIESKSGMEVVILRPPLIYGPGVGANFLRLLRAVERGLPLPFGWVENRRSLLYLGNFTDAIRVCLEHPTAVGKTFLLADGEDVSTAELARRLARSMHRPTRLLPVPASWLRSAGRLIGRSDEIDRLLGSLTVDSSKIRQELGWEPPFSVEAGLSETVRWYAGDRGKHAR